MVLEVLPTQLAVCRLSPTVEIPQWALRGQFHSITKTTDELSIVCSQADVTDDVKAERDWRCFKVQGPLDFGLTGVLASLANPLAQAGISIFAVSTFDTDYLMVKQVEFERAAETLVKAGHQVIGMPKVPVSLLSLQRIGLESEKTVQDILNDAVTYSRNTDGVERDPDGGRDTLTALPPNTSPDRKHVLLICQDEQFIGVVDLIQGYPDTETAFVGLFLLRERNQKQGVGRKAYFEVEEYAKNLGCRKMRLAVVDSNPVQPFWEKMGYKLTGDARPHEGKKLNSVKRVMEKMI